MMINKHTYFEVQRMACIFVGERKAWNGSCCWRSSRWEFV